MENKMTFTENQQLAIKDNGGTLLVAAGAGSGKTAVLTQRLIERVCSPDSEGNITDYLVVTFTKAATKELGIKLRKALQKEIAEHPENTRARRQLSMVGLAKIRTVDAFCYDFVRANFEALSLPPKCRLADECEASVMMNDIFGELIEEKYETEEKGSAFYKVTELLSGVRSDDGMIKSLLKLYRDLRVQPSPEKAFERYLAKYKEVEDCTEIFGTEYGKLIRKDVLFTVDMCRSDLEDLLAQASEAPTVYPLIEERFNAFTDRLAGVKTALDGGYENTKNYIASLGRLPNAGRKTKETDAEALDRIKKQFDDIKRTFDKITPKYFGASAEILRNAAKETYTVLSEIRDLLSEFDRRFTAKKLEKGLLDYTDIEKYALSLLCSDTGEFPGTFRRTELARTLSENFREIYIDEYQDINPVQDLIFRSLARCDEKSGTETNRFMVGDKKQSIYRFRGAKPDIFNDYVSSFPMSTEDSGHESTCHKVYLSNNFRCSENVIKATNSVFEIIMENYTEDEKLIFSKREANKQTAPTELVLLYRDKDETEAEDENGSEDTKQSDAKSSETEAIYVAARIKQMMSDPACRNENGEPYSYKDFAILSATGSGVDSVCKRVFRRAGIPLYCGVAGDFFELPEIRLVMCLLNCIDNPRRDIYMAGLMHSGLYGFSADELFLIRKDYRKMSFCTSVESFAKEEVSDALHEKVRAFLSELSEFRKLSRGTPADEFLKTVFDRTGILELYSGKEASKRKNILRVYEFARNFEKTHFCGLSSFLSYLDDMVQDNNRIESEAIADAVTMTTIHKSKGLEYPVVFTIGAASTFNSEDERKAIIYNEKYGIGTKLRGSTALGISEENCEISLLSTPFRHAIVASERSEMLEEKKRLLYVAMTRARDRLIITANVKDDPDAVLSKAVQKRKSGFAVKGRYSKSFLDYLLFAVPDKFFDAMAEHKKIIPSENDFFIAYTEKVTGLGAIAQAARRAETADVLSGEEAEKAASLLALLRKNSEKVPYDSPMSKIPAKLSVSSLKKGLLDEDAPKNDVPKLKAEPKFVAESTEADGAEKGTAAHIFMQFADYAALEKDGAAKEAERLYSLGFISERQYGLLDTSPLDAFVHSELFAMIRKSPKVYRERRFNLMLPAAEFTENSKDAYGDSFVLVQGVIDLYFENGDGSCTLVDFKTDRVKEPDGEAVLRSRHASQLGYYRRAVEEMTGRKVSRVLLYSFALGRCVEL